MMCINALNGQNVVRRASLRDRAVVSQQKKGLVELNFLFSCR